MRAIPGNLISEHDAMNVQWNPASDGNTGRIIVNQRQNTKLIFDLAYKIRLGLQAQLTGHGTVFSWSRQGMVSNLTGKIPL